MSNSRYQGCVCATLTELITYQRHSERLLILHLHRSLLQRAWETRVNINFLITKLKKRKLWSEQNPTVYSSRSPSSAPALLHSFTGISSLAAALSLRSLVHTHTTFCKAPLHRINHFCWFWCFYGICWQSEKYRLSSDSFFNMKSVFNVDGKYDLQQQVMAILNVFLHPGEQRVWGGPRCVLLPHPQPEQEPSVQYLGGSCHRCRPWKRQWNHHCQTHGWG